MFVLFPISLHYNKSIYLNLNAQSIILSNDAIKWYHLGPLLQTNRPFDI